MKNIIYLIILIVIIFGGLNYYHNIKPAPSLAEVGDDWLQVMNDIHTHWQDGVPLNDPYVIKNCPGLYKSSKDVNKELLSCRSLPFYCFYKERKRILYTKGKKSSYSISFPELKNDQWNLTLKVSKNENNKKEVKKLKLTDDCLKANVPLQAYNHGKYINKENTWHPGDVNYWVDKYLVRNIDLDFSYLQKTGNLRLSKELFKPVFVKNKKVMNDYCRYKKGRVLTSRLADAVTYYKSQRSSKINKTLSPYPFSVRSSSIPHFKVSKNKNINYAPTKKDCELIYSQECLELNEKRNPVLTLGWSGVGELLGGPFEYVDNELYPRRNLILSSYYFPYHSFVHRAGIRGYWDGEDILVKNFNFFTKSPDNHDQLFNISFRCSGVNN